MSEQDEPAGIWLDGEQLTPEDLTFREQRKFRDLTRDLAPDNDPEKAQEVDYIVALITVWKQRTDPGFTTDQALDFKPGDLEQKDTDPPTGQGH